MQQLIKQIKAAGAIGSDTAIAAHLKELGYSALVSEVEAQEIAQDFNSRSNAGGSGTIAPTTAKSFKSLPSSQRAMTKRGAKTRQNKSIVSQTSQEVEAYADTIEAGLSAYEGHQASQLVDRIRLVPHNIREQVETALEVAEYDPQSFSEDAGDLLERLGIQMEIPVGTVSATLDG